MPVEAHQKMFIGLAEFTEKTAQLNRERRSQVRPYVIIPYVGAILIVVTTALMLYLLGSPDCRAATF